MDARLKSYVVMKAVQMMNGKRGKSSVVKVLRGSKANNVVKAVEEFELTDLWGIFYSIPAEEIEQIIADMTAKGFLYTKQVQVAGYQYPMLFISDEGQAVLDALRKTQEERIREIHEMIYEFSEDPDVSDKGREVEAFIKAVVTFLGEWQRKNNDKYDLADLMKESFLNLDDRDDLEKFLYRNTLETRIDSWRTGFVLGETCRQLIKDLRTFLAALPELEAQIFRCHYGLEDQLMRPSHDIVLYYGIPEKEIPRICKRTLNRFGNKSWYRRFRWISRIADYVIGKKEFNDDTVSDLVKETSTVTYELYSRGLSLEAISRERGLQLSTIYGHFAHIIPKHNINLYDIIPQDRVNAILEVVARVGMDRLKPIKEQLPDDYTYGEIRVVVELEKSNRAA